LRRRWSARPSGSCRGWVLDPSIDRRALAPFAKSLFAVACEAALVIGWPVGWALATQRLVERGEARVLAALGERPSRTVARLVPQGIVLGAILVTTSLVLAREAAAPGRVIRALLAQGRTTCASATAPTTKGVPFVSVTWLCAGRASQGADPERGAPRLVGRAPVSGVVFTAEDASVSDDLRRIELARARIGLPISPDSTVRLRTRELVLRGLAPWARASALPPFLRAAIVTSAAFGSAWAAAIAILRGRRRRVSGVAAAAIGAAGPLAALALLRALELRVPEVAGGGWLVLLALVPCGSLLAVLAAAALVTALPEGPGADSK
jgi:hypothetical protein